MCQSVWCGGICLSSLRDLAEFIGDEPNALPGAPSPRDQAEITRINPGHDWRDGCLCGINIPKAFKGSAYRVKPNKYDSMAYDATPVPNGHQGGAA